MDGLEEPTRPYTPTGVSNQAKSNNYGESRIETKEREFNTSRLNIIEEEDQTSARLIDHSPNVMKTNDFRSISNGHAGQFTNTIKELRNEIISERSPQMKQALEENALEFSEPSIISQQGKNLNDQQLYNGEGSQTKNQLKKYQTAPWYGTEAIDQPKTPGFAKMNSKHKNNNKQGHKKVKVATKPESSKKKKKKDKNKKSTSNMSKKSNRSQWVGLNDPQDTKINQEKTSNEVEDLDEEINNNGRKIIVDTKDEPIIDMESSEEDSDSNDIPYENKEGKSPRFHQRKRFGSQKEKNKKKRPINDKFISQKKIPTNSPNQRRSILKQRGSVFFENLKSVSTKKVVINDPAKPRNRKMSLMANIHSQGILNNLNKQASPISSNGVEPPNIFGRINSKRNSISRSPGIIKRKGTEMPKAEGGSFINSSNSAVNIQRRKKVYPRNRYHQPSMISIGPSSNGVFFGEFGKEQPGMYNQGSGRGIRRFSRSPLAGASSRRINRPNLENSLISDNQPPLRRQATNVTKLGYFGDDDRDNEKKAMIDNKYFYYRHIVNFSLKQYLNFLVFHVVYYAIFGPFVIAFVICKPRLKMFYSNLLITRLSISFYAQTFYWISSMMIYYSYYNNLSIGDYALVHSLIVSTVLRCCTIAGKYATFQPSQINRYYETFISESDLNKELMMIDWLRQKPHIIREEIMNSLLRKEIDPQTLKLSFIIPLSDKVEDQLRDVADSIRDQVMKMKQKKKEKKRKEKERKNMILGKSKNKEGNEAEENSVSPQKNKFKKSQTINMEELVNPKSKYFWTDNNGRRYYDGRVVFEHLTSSYNKENPVSKLYILFLISGSIFYGIFSGLMRVARGESFHGSGALEITIFYWTALSNCFLIFTTVMFYHQAIRDLQNKNFMLEQLGQMISPRKDIDLSYTKKLPTINIIDPISLHTWTCMRRVCLDYGLRFFYRHQLFIPIVLMVGFIAASLAIALHYLLKENDIERTSALLDLKNYLYLDTVLMFTMFFTLLFKSARINNHFERHIKILKGNKDLFMELLRFKDYYFKDFFDDLASVLSDHKSFYHGILTGDTESYVHYRVAREIMFLSEGGDPDYIERRLKKLIETKTEFIEKLEDETEFYSLKVLGYRVTSTAVLNLLFAFVSIFFTAYEILFT